MADVLLDWDGFLAGVSLWVKSRRSPKCQNDGPAYLGILTSNVFPGLGVYSLSEVLRRSGLYILRVIYRINCMLIIAKWSHIASMKPVKVFYTDLF